MTAQKSLRLWLAMTAQRSLRLWLAMTSKKQIFQASPKRLAFFLYNLSVQTFSLLAKKILSIALTLFLILSASFFLLRSLPGSPFDQDRVLAPEIRAKMEAKYGLNKSLSDQYFSYLKGIIQGKLGPSLKYPNREVEDILADAIPVSLSLGFAALLVSLVVGITAGAIAALKPNSFFALLANSISSLGMSMPSFVFAAILIYIFGLQLKIFPVALWEGPSYMVLPVLTLAIAPCAYITRITKSALSEELNKDHIRAALARGLSKSQVLIKHGLRNAISPILTVVGPLAAILVTGSFVVEYVFALPGMGKYFVTAFINRDYFLVSGVVLVFASILLVTNSLVELFCRD